MDIFDEGDYIVVLADVPGVEERSVRVELEDQTLRLRAVGKYKEYRGEVELSAPIRPGSLAWTLNNGIIEARVAAQGRAGSRR